MWVRPVLAQTDPLAQPGSGSAAGSDAASVSPAAPDEASRPRQCDQITKKICSAQDTGLLVKSAAYVAIAVLVFSLLRVWWDKRGTRTAGIRFVATLLPAAGIAGVLTFFDPTRGQDLACCLADAVYKNEILFQDSGLARGAALGFVPAAALFVVVAISLKVVRS